MNGCFLASTFMSVGHSMLWWHEHLSQWSVAWHVSVWSVWLDVAVLPLARDGCVGEVVADQTLPHLLSHPNSHIQPSRLFRRNMPPESNEEKCSCHHNMQER